MFFTTIPAKTAGSSLKRFTWTCVGKYGVDNFINSKDMDERMGPFHENLTPPSIISNHVYSDETIIDLVKNAPRQSLVLFIHRDETDWLLSAVRHVVQTWICQLKFLEDKIQIKVDGSQCIIKEKDVSDYVIQSRVLEVKNGMSDIMTCEFYSAIEENFPTLVFVHYKQVDKVQKVLAKYHCPNLLDKEFHVNFSSQKSKKMQMFLKLKNNGKQTPLDDWLETKRDILEWTFQLRAG